MFFGTGLSLLRVPTGSMSSLCWVLVFDNDCRGASVYPWSLLSRGIIKFFFINIDLFMFLNLLSLNFRLLSFL